MAIPPLSRRSFLGAFAAGAGGAWLAAHWPEIASAQAYASRAARDPSSATWMTFTPEEATEIDAILAAILPSDGSPGAREAGAVHFLDRALDTFWRPQRDPTLTALAGFRQEVARRHPGASGFAALPPAAQAELLKNIEQTEFFAGMRGAAVVGYLCNVEYGGNQDRVGWRWIGFEDRFIWQAPFGYYDREDAGGP